MKCIYHKQCGFYCKCATCHSEKDAKPYCGQRKQFDILLYLLDHENDDFIFTTLSSISKHRKQTLHSLIKEILYTYCYNIEGGN